MPSGAEAMIDEDALAHPVRLALRAIFICQWKTIAPTSLPCPLLSLRPWRPTGRQLRFDAGHVLDDELHDLTLRPRPETVASTWIDHDFEFLFRLLQLINELQCVLHVNVVVHFAMQQE